MGSISRVFGSMTGTGKGGGGRKKGGKSGGGRKKAPPKKSGGKGFWLAAGDALALSI